MKKQYRFWISDSDQDLQKWLDELTRKYKFAKEIIKILDFVRLHGLKELESLESLKQEKIKTDIEYKKVQTQYMKLKMKYEFNFDDLPSPQADKALKQKAVVDVKGYEAPEEKKIANIIDYNWNKFLNQLRMRTDGWIASCKICNSGFIKATKESAIERFKKHLEENHSEELAKL